MDKKNSTTMLGLVIVLFAVALLSGKSALAADSTDDIQTRIAPVGQVNVAQPAIRDDATTEPDPAAASETNIADAAASWAVEGKKVYESNCVICHASGVAGAPKFGDEAAWKPLVATGMEAMLNNVKNGLNAMPPKGTCMNCDDQQLQDAILYMLPEDLREQLQN